jgi:cytochrome P450
LNLTLIHLQFVKFGLTTEAFESYVPLIADETKNMITNSKWMQGDSGILDLPPAMAELTIYTASRTLQGPEVRSKMNAEFAEYFHDLDAGFQPINFMLPWAPLPQNRRRDAANKKMSDTYLEIIKDRRAGKGKDSQDMIWNLMQCEYKGNVPISDDEIAHMMIALLMAGQHSSSSTSTWILLRLAQNPEMIEELLAEQKRVLGSDLPALTYENIQKLPLNAQVVKETLRMHAPIHSVMRQVTNPLPVEGTPFVIPTSHTLLSAPGVTSKMSQYFPNPEVWDPHRWNADRTVTGNGDEDGDNADEKIDYGYGMVSKGGNSPYLPFGAGRHRCIGEQFAYLQLGTIIATMVRELRFENMGGKGDKSIVGTDYSSLFSQPLRPATVRWVRREDGKKSA